MLRRGLEEERAEQVDHRRPGCRRAAGTTASPRARGAARACSRAGSTRSDRLEVRRDLRAPPRVVAERDRVGAGGEQLVGEPRRDPDAVGGVLAVDDADVDLELVAQVAAAGASTASRPGRPTTSAMKRIRRAAGASGRRGVDDGIDRDRDVVAVVGGVLRERLLARPAAMSATVPSFDGAGDDRRRRPRAPGRARTFVQRDDDRRCARRAQVDRATRRLRRR